MSKDKRQLRAEAVERLRGLGEHVMASSIQWALFGSERDNMPPNELRDALIDLLTDDERPDTFHDDFYDCESTVDKAEPQGADGNLDQAQIEWLRYMPDGWDGTTPEVPGSRNGCVSDSREKLEADVRRDFGELGFGIKRTFEWLDRQAAITERECDKLRNQVDERPCINGLRETTLDYTERLGEASKTLHIETRCTYDDLRVLCKTLMGVFE